MTPEARELMMNWIADMGPDHDDDCPGDDTCSCSMKPKNDAISACCMFLHNAPARIRELEAAVAERDEAMERCRTDWNHEVLRLRARLAAAEKVVEAAEGMHDTIAVRSLTPDGLYRRIDAALLAVPLAYLRSAINYYHAAKGGTQ